MQQDLFSSVYSVTEITSYVKELLEGEETLQDIFIKGEISQFTKAQSGHLYFSIKDNTCQLPCVMFRNSQTIFRMPNLTRGEMVILRGSFSVYQAQGKYQFLVSEIRKAGVGDLYQQYLNLKDKLEKEGLFKEERKRPLPFMPHRIGIAASLQGAVIHDIIRVFKNKFPHIEVILLPTLVQGITAAKDLCHSIEILNKIEGLELIILARGGGSFEELYCFNDETLARSISASAVPVVSAVGHESDFTIADFVADYRAATPTAAAERVVPDARELWNFLDHAGSFLKRQHMRLVRELRQRLDDDRRNLIFLMERGIGQKRAEVRYLRASLKCDSMKQQLKEKQKGMISWMKDKLTAERYGLEIASQRLQLLDVKQNLDRGYSLTFKNGVIVKTVEELRNLDELETVLAKGRVFSKITGLKRQ